MTHASMILIRAIAIKTAELYLRAMLLIVLLAIGDRKPTKFH